MIEAPEGKPSGDERILQDIVGLVRVANVPSNETIQNGFVSQHYFVECTAITALGGDDQLLLQFARVVRHGDSELSAARTVASYRRACCAVSTPRMAMMCLTVAMRSALRAAEKRSIACSA